MVIANATEQLVIDELRSNAGALASLLSELIAFDTVARGPDDPAGAAQEAALQEHLAARLRAAGLEVDVWEPDGADVAGSPLVPPGFRFEGRPQLLARRCGTGGGRSLLLNGHIDVVPARAQEGWSSDPFVARVAGGRVYGRGACDMKGGVAAMVVAAETLARLGIELRGDVLINTVTDEESTGAGTLAGVAHGVSADAAVVPEPTSLNLWTACRGSLMATVAVPGRGGHAGLGRAAQGDGPDAQRAVNAIDNAAVVLSALQDLRTAWADRLADAHPLLGPGDIVPTAIRAGGWAVSHPPECELELHVSYLPAQADAEGWGHAVREEIEACVARAAAGDPWLSDNAPVVRWSHAEVPPYDVPAEQPIVRCAAGAATAVGAPGGLATQTTWFDAATLTRAGTPAIGYGPGSIATAHAADEHVAIDELVACAQGLALMALRFCS
jgi:acetylornithine deacetylase